MKWTLWEITVDGLGLVGLAYMLVELGRVM